MIARFRRDGVDLELTIAEYDFLYLTLTHVLYGITIADHDFANILGMGRADAEALMDSLMETERIARSREEHWNPHPPVAEFPGDPK